MHARAIRSAPGSEAEGLKGACVTELCLENVNSKAKQNILVTAPLDFLPDLRERIESKTDCTCVYQADGAEVDRLLSEQASFPVRYQWCSCTSPPYLRSQVTSLN